MMKIDALLITILVSVFAVKTNAGSLVAGQGTAIYSVGNQLVRPVPAAFHTPLQAAFVAPVKYAYGNRIDKFTRNLAVPFAALNPVTQFASVVQPQATIIPQPVLAPSAPVQFSLFPNYAVPVNQFPTTFAVPSTQLTNAAGSVDNKVMTPQAAPLVDQPSQMAAQAQQFNSPAPQQQSTMAALSAAPPLFPLSFSSPFAQNFAAQLPGQFAVANQNYNQPLAQSIQQMSANSATTPFANVQLGHPFSSLFNSPAQPPKLMDTPAMSMASTLIPTGSSVFSAPTAATQPNNDQQRESSIMKNQQQSTALPETSQGQFPVTLSSLMGYSYPTQFRNIFG